jgi:hypothetical protein
MNSIYNAITKVIGKRFVVSSMTNPNTKYVIKRLFGHYVCSCPDCQIRDRECKHIRAIKSGAYPVGKVYAF